MIDLLILLFVLVVFTFLGSILYTRIFHPEKYRVEQEMSRELQKKWADQRQAAKSEKTDQEIQENVASSAEGRKARRKDTFLPSPTWPHPKPTDANWKIRFSERLSAESRLPRS